MLMGMHKAYHSGRMHVHRARDIMHHNAAMHLYLSGLCRRWLLPCLSHYDPTFHCLPVFN